MKQYLYENFVCKLGETAKENWSLLDKCINHGGGKRCPNCIDWIDSRCRKFKYDDYFFIILIDLKNERPLLVA